MRCSQYLVEVEEMLLFGLGEEVVLGFDEALIWVQKWLASHHALFYLSIMCFCSVSHMKAGISKYILI